MGAAAEREARKILEGWGYYVVRASASKGAADLLAIRPGGLVLFVQVKRGKGRLRPPAWNELLSLARRYGAVPILAERVVRQPMAWYRLDGPKAEGGRARQPMTGYDPEAGAAEWVARAVGL